ncbi:MAG: MacS family sensor histidine kinase [Actinopolymorphaceae bacterium]
MGHPGDGPDPAASLWKGLAVLRFVFLAQALAVNLLRWPRLDHPMAVWFVLSAMAAWTLLISWAYDAPSRRRWQVLTADLGVAVGALLTTPYILSDQMLQQHDFTVPTYWVTAPVLAWAIHRGWVGGLLAGLVMVPVDLSTRAVVNDSTLGNMFLLLLAALVVGYTSALVRQAAADRARATELAARTAERERLARAVHDGVLQVLAYVQRRGLAIGGEAAELGYAAGEQEERLRNLIRGTDPLETAAHGQVDLGRELAGFAATKVSVATPAEPVPVPPKVARELVAAVKAALDNVLQHADGARTYLLLEDDEDGVVVSVRDDGPGIAPGRLEEAAAAGRMGVSRSIVGRLAELGGTATSRSAPGDGTEWELRVPHDLSGTKPTRRRVSRRQDHSGAG